MLLVVLNILKIIGIILLSIIGILLFIICIILFVPIRYKIIIKKKESDSNLVDIKGQISYLLHLISLKAFYPEKEKTRFKILFFTLYPRKTKQKNRKRRKNKNNKYNDYADNISNNTNENASASNLNITENDSFSCEDKAVNTDSQSTNSAYKENCKNNKELDDKKSLINKIKDIINNIFLKIKNTINIIIDTVKELKNNLDYYLDIINGQPFQKAFKLCKKELIKLIKIILPRSVKGYIDYGAENPSVTANIFGIYSIVYPYLGNKFIFNPYLNEEVFECEISLIGHVRIISLLIICIKIYFNKDIKKTLRLFKKEK